MSTSKHKKKSASKNNDNANDLRSEIANMASSLGLSSCNKNPPKDKKFKNTTTNNNKKHNLMKENSLGVWYEDMAKLEKKLLDMDRNNKVKAVVLEMKKNNAEEWKCLVNKKKEIAGRLLSQYIQDYEQQLRGDIKMVLATQRSGTATDKVSAALVLIGDNPIANINSIDILLGMVTRKVGKRYAFTGFEALKQIFISSLLPDRKLETLDQQPLNRLPDSKDGNSLLLLWHWEECLKQKYESYISALDEASRDTLATLKDKAMKTIYVLLRSKSEQERKLLSILVNKLGDPENKAASNASYLLLKLLSDHPNMNAVVVDYVDSFLFRPHLTSRAKYNSVIFLSQIRLSHHGEGRKVAKRLLDIYFALFKVLISETGGLDKQKTSKDDFRKTFSSFNDMDAKHDAESHVVMDSKLLPALLNGVKRAFSYVSTNEADDVIEPHIPMLFQLVHSKNFNVGLQALMLLEHISSKNQVVSDRLYRALYSTLLLKSAMNTSKEEMFIGLLSRVVKNDLNLKRVSAFAKRILQVSLQQPPEYTCACLLLLSEVLKSKPLLWNIVLQNELPDEEELEHFEDMVEEPDMQERNTANKPDSDEGDDSANDNDDSSEDESAPSSDDEYLDKGDDDLLGFGGLVNLQEPERTSDQTASQLRVQDTESSLPGGYNIQHREPIYCNADRVGWWELTALASHVHPSVSSMARTLLSGANIVYNGNPIKDLSLGAFLGKFLEKKPKARNWHGGSQIEPAKQLDMDKPLIGLDILQLDEMDVAPDDVFFHRFYMNKQNASKKPKKKKKKGVGEEAAEDLTGEGEDDDSDNEEIDAILDSTNPALDSKGDDYDYDDLDQVADEDDNNLVCDGTSDEELSIRGLKDESDEEEDMLFEVKPRKRKARGEAGSSPFASLEAYEHLLNDNEYDNENIKGTKKQKKSRRG